jgi:hypothetical protein
VLAYPPHGTHSTHLDHGTHGPVDHHDALGQHRIQVVEQVGFTCKGVSMRMRRGRWRVCVSGDCRKNVPT